MYTISLDDEQIVEEPMESIEYVDIKWWQDWSLFRQKGSYWVDLPQKDFRSDIQVMRCLAVILVILFHMDIPFFQGGFIAVDVFFVISSYLVIGSIYKQCLNDQFDYLLFLSSRIKRLFPASMVCLLFISFLFIFLNENWYDIVWASLHGANIHFYVGENQYFKPAPSYMLHYWSLALEEQFYFLFPLVIVGYYKLISLISDDYKRFFLALFTMIIMVVSFAFCLIPQLSGMKFYLLHSRIWEFLAGALVSLYQENISNELRIKMNEYEKLFDILNVMRYLGILSLIICSMFISSDNYPNEKTLIVVLITSLILAFDYPIENVLLETIGNWSYSIYLYHFPIIQLFKMVNLSFELKFLLIVLCITVLSVMSFYLVERVALRINIPPIAWMVILIIGSGMVALMASLLFVYPSFVFVTPMNGSYYNKSFEFPQLNEKEIELLKYNSKIVSRTGYLGKNLDTYISKKLEFTSILKGFDECLLIYGDSNAMQWFPAITTLSNFLNSSIFFADSYDRFHTGQVYDEREGEAFITHSLLNNDFQHCKHVITIFARTSMHLWDYDKKQLNEFSKRLQRLTTFFQKRGNVIVIEGIPRNVNNLNDDMNATWDETQSVFSYQDLVKPEILLSMNRYLCQNSKCPGHYREIPIYMDITHLSEGYVWFLTNTFVDEIMHKIK